VPLSDSCTATEQGERLTSKTLKKAKVACIVMTRKDGSADKGLRQALSEDSHVRDALKARAGRITYRAVADALKLAYADADHALRS
jgi:alanine dehydrogenase